ncbi:transcriptional regulator [Herbaspirillum robiniae]|uniref:transcriptional regulator n=1 Tax=Herbaspirillum robiniae TaxID=2014887 RepID=UPI0009A16B6B|nr:YdaS family helix-turn-helix protein [Herbaspirillum robiniae]
MDLKTYIRAERGRATKLAAGLGISTSYLSQMAGGEAPISAERAVQIEQMTGREVTRKDMFPESWERTWPELLNAD